MTDSKVYGKYKGPYRQKSVKKRIEALFLGNLGKVLDRELIQRAARDPNQWQALCGRHQVTKKNCWDSSTGKMNTYAIVQFSTRTEKELVFMFLLEYFGYEMDSKGGIKRK